MNATDQHAALRQQWLGGDGFPPNDYLLRPRGKAWMAEAADKVLEKYPDAEVYTCSSGISPSGMVHFGNFRDIATTMAVAAELRARGKRARVLFSWDNFDRFRKVPAGVSMDFMQHIGKPLTAVPSPDGVASSYADYFQRPFVQALARLGVEVEFRYQTDHYTRGDYTQGILTALQRREDIAGILLAFMSAKSIEEQQLDMDAYIRDYWPVSVYSRYTGKDNTTVLGWDGADSLRYRCNDTGQEDTASIAHDGLIKLAWKIDWPMRWAHEQVHFEPGGKDHSTPGGSYDTSAVIAREIYGRTPPVYAGYEFVGIQGQGSKMSGSKGNAVTPLQLLDIYEPALLLWLYTRVAPLQAFELAFGSEMIRQYDEYDRACAALAAGTLTPEDARPLRLAGAQPTAHAASFRQVVALGQLVQWDAARLREVLAHTGVAADADSVARRLPLARAWLEQHNPEEAIALLPAPNAAYAAVLPAPRLAMARALAAQLAAAPAASIDELTAMTYAIPKAELPADAPEAELKAAQRQFFTDVYQLLIGRDTGPRLGTFLALLPRERVLQLLAV